MGIDHLRKQLILRGIATPATIRGCTQEEIESVESTFAIRLPEEYAAFLKVFGKQAGDFLKGSDIFYPRIFQLRGYAEEILHEGKSNFSLPANAFVFCSHQGYQFMYFLADAAHPDPEIHYFLEGDSQPNVKWPSFSRFLWSRLDPAGA